MAAFLWFSILFFKKMAVKTYVRLSYLNKITHLDLFYTVRMPEVFLLVHPVGSVIGRILQKFLAVYQNCTVVKRKLPVFGEE